MSDSGELLCRFAADSHSADEILLGFYDWLEAVGITPYPAQEEAFMEIASEHHVILQTPTGSGKSLVATCAHLHAILKRQKSVYTSPIKALVNEKYRGLCVLFGEANVGLLTGDHTLNPEALILCCTAEVLASMAANQWRDSDIACVIMDEFHYYADRQRGMAWQLPLFLLNQTQFLLMSATLGDTTHIADALEARSQRQVSLVEGTDRPVPLSHHYLETGLQESIATLVESSQTPCYVVAFTHNDVTRIASGLLSITTIDRAKRVELRDRLATQSFNTPFGKELKRLLLSGVGVHYGGMLPRYRALVEQLA
ncbi:MAG: DEAD/DEAH box helicase, partial [Bradymonadia bacterium]